MPKLAKTAVGFAGLAASATGNTVHQTDYGPNAGIFTGSPPVDYNEFYPSYKESLGDFRSSYLTEGNGNQGTFRDIDDATKPFHEVYQTGYDNKAGVFVKQDDENLKPLKPDGRNYADVASDLSDYNREYKTIGQNPGTFINSPTVKDYPSLKESLGDLRASKIRDFNPESDEAFQAWNNREYGGKKRTKRYKRRLTHRKKKTIKRRKTRRTKRRR